MAGLHYRRQWLFSLCAVCSLTAFLVPLLTLWGVRVGVVGTLTSRLIDNPRNLELRLIGEGRFKADFFRELKGNPDTAFVIPQTRTLAAVVQLDTQAKEPLWVDISATGPGDPLLKDMEVLTVPDGWPKDRVIYLSAAAAEKVGFQPGRPLRGKVGRSFLGRLEHFEMELAVAGIIPRHVLSREIAYCSLYLMNLIENYRDGLTASPPVWPEGKEAVLESYAGFRLYAKTLDGVERLRQVLVAQGLDIYTRSEDIAQVRNLDDSFKVVFVALSLVVGLGAFASVSSSALDQVAKMRRSLALMCLLGFSSGGLMVFTLSQAALTGVLAAGLADGLFLAVAWVLNAYFGPSLGFGESVCRLEPWHYAVMAGATLIFMLAATAAACWKLTGVEPAEGMRDV